MFSFGQDPGIVYHRGQRLLVVVSLSRFLGCVMVKVCREWESKHVDFLVELWNDVFHKLDGEVGELDPPGVSGAAAQIANDAAELVLHIVDPSGRSASGSCFVNSERVGQLLERLEGNFGKLRELAGPWSGPVGQPEESKMPGV